VWNYLGDYEQDRERYVRGGTRCPDSWRVGLVAEFEGTG
jgi:hypothetical protein